MVLAAVGRGWVAGLQLSPATPLPVLSAWRPVPRVGQEEGKPCLSPERLSQRAVVCALVLCSVFSLRHRKCYYYIAFKRKTLPYPGHFQKLEIWGWRPISMQVLEGFPPHPRALARSMVGVPLSHPSPCQEGSGWVLW